MNDISETTKQTPGQILKAAREARQISIAEIAQRLLLSKVVIIAIENDDYSKIPAPVYAEGYLKAYAQFLGIQTSDILESFRRSNFYSISEKRIETKTMEQTTKKLPKLANLLKEEYRNYVISGIFAFLILTIVIFFIGKHFFIKNEEIINVPSIPDNTINKNSEVISDSQLPIVTTTTEDTIKSETETDDKQKNASKKTEKQNNKNVSLMLDSASSETKKNDNSEPKLILTHQ
jgi:cytoskeleton protein RodZ